MFAAAPPRSPARRADRRRYETSPGVPDAVDEEQPSLFEGFSRVAVAAPRDARDAPGAARPAAADDGHRFEVFLRRRCAVPYWALHVAGRVAETSGRYLQTGTGQDAGAIWTAFCVGASTAALAAPPETRDRFVEHAPAAVLANLVAKNAIRLRHIFALEPGDLALEVGRLEGTFNSPAYLAYMCLLAFGMPLIASGRFRFQALMIATNVALSGLVIVAARADPFQFVPPLSLYVAAVAASNVVIAALLRPRWRRARAVEDARLEKRADELDAAKDFVVWQWRFDAMRVAAAASKRVAAAASSSSASISSSLVEDALEAATPGSAPDGVAPAERSPSPPGSVGSASSSSVSISSSLVEDVLEAPDGVEHAERGPDPDRADTP